MLKLGACQAIRRNFTEFMQFSPAPPVFALSASFSPIVPNFARCGAIGHNGYKSSKGDLLVLWVKFEGSKPPTLHKQKTACPLYVLT